MSVHAMILQTKEELKKKRDGRDKTDRPYLGRRWLGGFLGWKGRVTANGYI